MSVKDASKPPRLIGLTRKSKGEDEGTHDDQRRIIEERCAREGFTLVRVDSKKGISGTKKWREREVGRAVEDCVAGKADGIIVAFEDRISRESMGETAAMWDSFREVGLVFIACDGVDSRVEGSNLTFAIKAAIARDKIEVTAKRSNLGRARVVAAGIHGGDTAPFGYTWTDRVDGSKNLSGNAKHGPLDLDPDKAPIAVQVFERRAAGASRKELVLLTGLSENAGTDMLKNRVYLGVAYSGGYVNNNGVGEGLLEGTPCKPTHPALVTPELFERVQRTFQRKRPSKVIGRDNSLLSRVLVCGSCGVGHLVLDRSLRSYRCKRDGLCEKPVTITDHRIEPYVFHRPLAWHAVLNPMYEVETNEALPEVTKALAEALSERDEIQADESLSSLRRAQACVIGVSSGFAA